MKAIFTYLTGGRAGQAVVVEKSYAMIGRAPQADVRFGPDHDLPVSGRHAAVIFRDGDWILRDLASTNGTFVNGVRIAGEHQLNDQDLVRLGDGGPMLRFGVIRDQWRPGPADLVAAAPPAVEPEVPVAAPAIPKTPLSTATPLDDGRFVAPVTATRTRAPWVAALLVIGVLGSLGMLATWRAKARRASVDERAVLLAQADSLFATLENIGRRDSRISGALDGAKAETARLRSRIRRAPQDPVALAPLRDSLDRLTVGFERLAAAAALDAQKIAQANEPALALVTSSFADEAQRHSTGFLARRAKGDLVLVTSATGVRDSGGVAQEIAVLLPGAGKPLRSRVIALHDSLDLALLELPRGLKTGPTPLLASGITTALVGQAAVLLGHAATTAPGSTPAQATALAAITIASDTRLQLEPFGSGLAAGSPVFDRAGTVIGMLLPSSARDRLLSAVPAPAIAAFLDGNTGAR